MPVPMIAILAMGVTPLALVTERPGIWIIGPGSATDPPMSPRRICVWEDRDARSCDVLSGSRPGNGGVGFPVAADHGPDLPTGFRRGSGGKARHVRGHSLLSGLSCG